MWLGKEALMDADLTYATDLTGITVYTVTTARTNTVYTHQAHAALHHEALTAIPDTEGMYLKLERRYHGAAQAGKPYWRLEISLPGDPTELRRNFDEDMPLANSRERNLGALIGRIGRVYIEEAPGRIAAARRDAAKRERQAASAERAAAARRDADGLIESSRDLAALLRMHAPTAGDPTEWDAIVIPIAAGSVASFAVNRRRSTPKRLVLADLPYAADRAPDGWRPAQMADTDMCDPDGNRIELDWLTVTRYQYGPPEETHTHRTPAAARRHYDRLCQQLFAGGEK